MTDLDDLAERILAFQARSNATARLFDWIYTRQDARGNSALKPVARSCGADYGKVHADGVPT